MRRVLPLVVGFVVLVPLGSAGAVSARTKVSLFRAFAAAGTPTVKATTVPGLSQCGTRSQVAPRRDAYLCEAQINGRLRSLDPCFVSPHDTMKLLCPSDDLRAGRLIKVAAPLSGSPPAVSARAIPFNVELSGGDHCLYKGRGGSTSFINGIRLNYDCPGGLGLWGAFDSKRQPWTISAFGEKSPQPHFSRRRAVVHVWQ